MIDYMTLYNPSSSDVKFLILKLPQASANFGGKPS